MSISSVATRIGIALDPHIIDFIRSELTVRRNEMWAQGCSRLLEDEIIEGLMDDIYDDGNTNEHSSSAAETIGLDAF
jgi:hypothetical protein